MKIGGWQLVARSIVFVDPQREKHHFLLRQRADGALRLERSAPGAARHLCVLARALVYRRRLHSRPATQRGVETLLRSATEYFPAGLQPATYCVTDGPEGAYLCALPQAEADTLAGELGSLQGILVGGEAPAPHELLDAIEQRGRLGRATDLASQPARIVSPARVAFAGALAALAAVAAACAWMLSAAYPGTERLTRELAAAERAAGAAPRQYESISKMLAAQRALGDFRRAPGANALDVVMAILDSAPAGHALTSIELKNGELKLTGMGSAPAEWLGAKGIPPGAISTYRLQQIDRFTAQFPLPKPRAPGS